MTTQLLDASRTDLTDREIATALNACLDREMIAPRDLDFARSLARGFYRYASFTPRQRPHVIRLVTQATEAYLASRGLATPAATQTVAARAATPTLPSMAGVVALIERAAQHVKFPKLWLQFADGTDLRITRAGDRSKYAGQLQLTDGKPFGQNQWFGAIAQDGRMTLGRDGYARQAELVELLTRLAAEPAKVAAEFGHLTGHCCFCAKPLADERSLAVGYGKTCASNFGLDWGTAKFSFVEPAPAPAPAAPTTGTHAREDLLAILDQFAKGV